MADDASAISSLDATGGDVGLPTGRGAGLAHAALALGGFAIGTTEFATMSFLPAFSADFGVGAPAGGHVISAYALGVVIGAPLLAVFGARVEKRALLVLLIGWFAIGNALSAMALDLNTLMVLRFVTALPHGAYFGVAVLAAAKMVAPGRRSVAIGRVLLGLTLATIAGVPLANLVSQWLGWRAGFGLFAALAFVATLLLGFLVPRQSATDTASPLRELGALARPQVWFALGIGAVGFGGMFAVYTYLASTLINITKAPLPMVPIILMTFGVGLTLGNILAPRLIQYGVMKAAGILLAWSAVVLAIYPSTVSSTWTIGLAVFCIGCGGGLGTVLQTRLMDVAGDAQNLAAALNHSAFNVANALGPLLGGLAIASGYGWASAGWVGCALALGGFAIWVMALVFERRSDSRLA